MVFLCTTTVENVFRPTRRVRMTVEFIQFVNDRWVCDVGNGREEQQQRPKPIEGDQSGPIEGVTNQVGQKTANCRFRHD